MTEELGRNIHYLYIICDYIGRRALEPRLGLLGWRGRPRLPAQSASSCGFLF